MFVDYAKIYIQSGKGGDGKVSFHTEKYVPNGGPDGGDGGKGGDIIFVASSNLSSLETFRYKRKYIAEDGEVGGRRKKFGKNGADLIIQGPVGTILRDETSMQILADLSEDGEKIMIAKGGKGGRGNVHFANSVRQAPNFAKPGEAGESYNLLLELKLIADVGLIGLPNVGKSTFLSVVTSARPKIADYHFTTLHPNLGVASCEDFHFVIADIPGLIEGASDGQGLGHDFLRHIERTKLLVHLVDVSGSEGRDPLADFKMINRELEEFSPKLKERPQIVVASKIDLASEEQIESFRKEMAKLGHEIFPICAAIHEGTSQLLYKISRELKNLPKVQLFNKLELGKKIYKFEKDEYKLTKVEDGIMVSGKWIDNLLAQINFDDVDSLNYFQRQLKLKGVIEALKKAGIKEGDTVYLDDLSFEFQE